MFSLEIFNDTWWTVPMSFFCVKVQGPLESTHCCAKKHDKNCPIFCKVLQVWNKFHQSKTKKFLFCNEFDHLICSKLFFWIQDFFNANKFVDQRLEKSDRSSKIWLFDLIWLVIDFHIEYDQWSFASIVAFSIAFNLSHIEKNQWSNTIIAKFKWFDPCG